MLYQKCNCFQGKGTFKDSKINHQTVVEFVKFYLNISEAYDQVKKFRFPKPPTVVDSDIFDNTRNDEDQTLVILIYQKGAFYHSQVFQPIGENEPNTFYVEQEVIDKSNTKEVFNCKEYDEDNCLRECLVSRFINEMGCLHVRLYDLANDAIVQKIQNPIKYNNISNTNVLELCNYNHLRNPTGKYVIL